MRARDDSGHELNAEFSIEADWAGLSLVLESAGGRVPGSQFSRNHQYVPALRVLLERLRALEAVLISGIVDSTRVEHLPEAERRLVHGPVLLADVDDIEQLRLELTTSQGRIGQSIGARKEGNNRKRLRLRLEVPGYDNSDADRLAADLAEPLAAPAQPADAADRTALEHSGDLDGAVAAKYRREQARLRRILGGGGEYARCAICGNDFPSRFLVAAHLKRRAECSDTERRDLHNVAMLACTFGCDALYEAGWITVAGDGRIVVIPPGDLPTGAFRDRITTLGGRRCDAHRPLTEPYFAWHRDNVFLGIIP